MVAEDSRAQVLEVAVGVHARCHEPLRRFPLARVDYDSSRKPLRVVIHLKLKLQRRQQGRTAEGLEDVQQGCGAPQRWLYAESVPRAQVVVHAAARVPLLSTLVDGKE